MKVYIPKVYEFNIDFVAVMCSEDYLNSVVFTDSLNILVLAVIFITLAKTFRYNFRCWSSLVDLVVKSLSLKVLLALEKKKNFLYITLSKHYARFKRNNYNGIFIYCIPVFNVWHAPTATVL